ncbi:FxsA family protein [Aliidiomarina sp. Khilg15.8]
MFRILLLLFIALPIIEIAVLLQVGEIIGGWNTLLLIIVTAVAGAALVRQQGALNWQRAQQKLASGEMPGVEMANGLLIFVAGIVLITPGFVTDIMGLLLLIPATRAPIAAALMKRMVVRSAGGSAGFAHFRAQGQSKPHQEDDDSVIDGEYERKRGPESQIDSDDKKK